MNKEIEILYKTLEAKDKIINEQALEIARLKEIIEKLEKENKQLKEELERNAKANVVLDNTNKDYASIIFDLEEWLQRQKEHFDHETGNVNIGIYIAMREVFDKIQKLKEKYNGQ